MKTLKHLLTGVLFLLFYSTQSFALSPGDIAFVQYNADGSTDEFAWVALANIPGNEVISFTENGWLSTNALRTGEGTISWTAPPAGVSAGTIVSIDYQGITSTGCASVSGSFQISTGGDQIIAYTGTSASPNIIAAINGDGAWRTSGTINSNSSYLPTGLTNGSTAIAINPETDNAVFNTMVNNNTQAILLSDINNISNWTLNNTTNQTFSGSFTVTSPTSPASSSGYSFTLNDCDIAFTSYNSTDPDIFSFVALAAIPAGETLFFTDNGWYSSGTGFRSGEGVLEWTAPAGGVAQGTVVTYNTSTGFSVGTNNPTGSFGLSTGGDQIHAYQGGLGCAPVVYTHIAAIQMNGAWDADAISTNTSSLPTGLVGNVIPCNPEVDNAAYTGITSGSVSDLKTALLDPANWNCSASVVAGPVGPFTFVQPTISLVDSDGDGIPDITDPCSCADPLNILDGAGNVIFFHDFIEITGTTGDVWEISPTTTLPLFNNAGVALPNGTVIPEIGVTGIFYLDVWHPDVTGFNADFDRTTGGAFTLSESNACDNATCLTAPTGVPTLSEWGLIVFMLLLMTGGTLVLQFGGQLALSSPSGNITVGSMFKQPVFEKRAFAISVGFVVLLAILAGVSTFAIYGSIAMIDLIGTLIAAPILAYFVHLFGIKE